MSNLAHRIFDRTALKCPTQRPEPLSSPDAQKACNKTLKFLGLGLVFSCLPRIAILLCCGGCKTCAARPPPELHNPPPLPERHIDIGQKRLTKQSQGCTLLLELPLEIRECIYEAALGGRWISMKLGVTEASREKGHFVVQSTIYQPIDDSDELHSLPVDDKWARRKPELPPSGEGIPIALLLTCRQVYLEALPIMHRRNTFYFQADQFAPIVLSSLGLYCLPNIRSISIVHYVDIPNENNTVPWESVFALIREMRLESLEFGFAGLTYKISEIRDASWIHSEWVHGILFNKKGLRRFRFFVRDRDRASSWIDRSFRQMLFGHGADDDAECY
ncbi:hypothetical protein B0H19DRAFT_1293719 [Mycena capillaripes]|nr:hypothetical protein B0H19DRAFT_1293719 [Mycena capillaripes]